MTELDARLSELADFAAADEAAELDANERLAGLFREPGRYIDINGSFFPLRDEGERNAAVSALSRAGRLSARVRLWTGSEWSVTREYVRAA